MENQNHGTLGDLLLKPEPIIISDLVVKTSVWDMLFASIFGLTRHYHWPLL